ncbi:putative DnaJ domain-containing protein [Lupinus albus]|uniref:Putative DnaJ domain-containing protein n=1 Tax=Lupinus albus TaxID=3870 RepID=A0A6A4PAG1_LUPAL|nr:putative DnaJ domain-containing protein [Lupinus albus]
MIHLFRNPKPSQNPSLIPFSNSITPMVRKEDEEEALRLKGLAESKFKSNHLNSSLKYAKRAQRLAPNLHSISEIVTSLTILRAAARSSTTTTIPNWYKILDLEPFSNINLIRKQYKKLAFILHPDKNSFLGSDEAFKLVGEASKFLSDKVRKQDYDMKLRMWIQEEKENENVSEEESGNTFWTVCSTCKLLHKFERRYVGHNLICPSCNKSFKAVEEVNDHGSKQNEQVGSKGGSFKLKENVEVDGGETLGEFMLRRKLKSKGVKGKMGSEKDGFLKGKVGVDEVGNGDMEKEGFSEWGGGRLRTSGLRKSMSMVGEVLERSDPKRIKTGEETMTLAEFQSEVKKRLQQKKVKEKEEEGNDKRSTQGEKLEGSKNNRGSAAGKVRSLKKSVKLAIKEKHQVSMKKKELRLHKHKDSSGGNLENMAVVDSDFYDFDKDRTERSFKKGQVWAIYDDDDGMPRSCALIDEFVSENPFEVRVSWLDLQNNRGKTIISLNKMGVHIPCGRFKVTWKTTINSINIFSHCVDCDRAARELYNIYPKKGSVWALYGEASVDVDTRSFKVGGKRCYDIVVFFTSYSEVNGLSVAYLKKVDGYKTVFKRQEMGSHAIRFLGKDDMWLISHQIPARKFPCNDETPELLKDCWELDPASLPSELLTIGGVDN